MTWKSISLSLAYFLASAAAVDLVGVVSVPPPAEAYTYDGAAAANYAHKWADNGKHLRNSKYESFGNDCTNFVSQSLRAGGWSMDTNGSDQWWYVWNTVISDLQSRSWVNALGLSQYVRASGRSDGFKLLNMSSQYTPAHKGDVYAFEFGDDDGIDHLALASGWGQFADYYDSKNRKSYRSVTGGQGDYLSQHTADRDYAPWNWGYWVESNLTRRAKKRTVWLGIN